MDVRTIHGTGSSHALLRTHQVSQVGGTCLEPEHILLGLLHNPGDVVGRILIGANVSYQEVWKQIDQVQKRHPKLPTSVEIPFAAETLRVFQYAAQEADGLAHSHIGTEHLLLGLLRERGTIAERCLAQRGLLRRSCAQASPRRRSVVG